MTGIYKYAMAVLDERVWEPNWCSTIRTCVRHGEGNFCKLWEALGPEIGLAGEEFLRRGVALYYWFCTLNLVDDIMDGDCDYVTPREQPLAVLAMCNEMERALARTTIRKSALVDSATRMGWCISGQSSEANGCGSMNEYIEIGDRIAGDQFAVYFGLFADGTTFEKDAGECGRMYGRAAHVLKDFRDKDSRLLECGDVPGVVAWALEGLATAAALSPPPSVVSRIEKVRAMLQALDDGTPKA